MSDARRFSIWFKMYYIYHASDYSYLEVGIGEYVGSGVKVLELLEGRHDLGPGDAALLVDELDGRALSVVRHAVAHHHVELVLVVLDAEHHRHRLPDLDDARHLVGVRTLPHLDLHPAAQVVAQEVGRHRVQHVHLVRLERHSLLVKVVPEEKKRVEQMLLSVGGDRC